MVTALVVPQFHEKYAKPTPQNPPTLKEVRLFSQARCIRAFNSLMYVA